MQTMLFGDDNAIMDPLLAQCYVQPKEVSDKPILTGRWGIGKTAFFFHSNAKLFDVLKTISCDDPLLWFIGETALDIGSLTNLRSRFNVDKEGFKRSLELLWKAEIVRTMCMLLSKLQDYYDCPVAHHWQLISKAAKTASIVQSVWKRIPNLMWLLLGKDKGQEIATLANILGNKHCQGMLDIIQCCLRDVQDQKVQPIVLIEPLDTPLSGLEDAGIAQTLITALLNVYYNTFAPSQDQLIQLHISIPWHRYKPKEVDFPQRFPEYVGHIRWNMQSLKDFVNRRIEWEFQRVRRSFSGRVIDAWNALFEAHISDGYCESKVREDSFRCFLRHTHYRPRDLQRLMRRAVKMHAAITRTSVDEVLQGKGGRKIPASTMKEAIREVSTDTMTKDFIPEVSRKYKDTEVLINLLSGISMPFTIDDIKRRYRRIHGTDVALIRLNNIVDQLWASGVIGIEIVPASEKDASTLSRVLPKEAFCQYTTNGKNISRWYLFTYNWEGNPFTLLLRYEKSDEAAVAFVLHPRTFRYLLPSLREDCPIGV